MSNTQTKEKENKVTSEEIFDLFSIADALRSQAKMVQRQIADLPYPFSNLDIPIESDTKQSSYQMAFDLTVLLEIGLDRLVERLKILGEKAERE